MNAHKSQITANAVPDGRKTAMTRRLCVQGTIAALSLVAFAAEAKTDPIIAYADALMPDWHISGWAKNTPQFNFADGTKPIEISMPGWSTFALQTGTPIDTTKFETLTVVVNGGAAGKQELNLVLKAGDKAVSEIMVVKCDKGQWVRVDIPLKRMKIKEAIDTVFINNSSGDAMDTFYLNYVLFQ